VHPCDLRRAMDYLRAAAEADLTVADAVDHARSYLETAQGWPTDLETQLDYVREFFTWRLRN